MRFLRSARRWLALAAAALAAAASLPTLTACGGNGDSTPMDCSPYYVVMSFPGYELTGSLSIASALTDATVGQPLAIDAPTLSAADQPAFVAPASCMGITGWSATGLPPGVAIDARTGALSGTPTQGGLFNATIQFQTNADSRVGVSGGTFAFQVHDPATTLISSWDAGQPMPSGNGLLATQGGDLVWLQPGATSIEVRRSVDGGATWTLDTPATAPPMRLPFYVATDDAGRLYLSGGYIDPATPSTAVGDLWVYDGVDWTELYTLAPFRAAVDDGVFLYAAEGALFALNLTTNTLWRSADGGVSWAQVGTHVVPDQFGPWCAGTLAGKQAIVGEELSTIGFGHPPSLRAIQSTDGGATWTEPNQLGAGLSGISQCQFASGHVFVAGAGLANEPFANVLATSDLDQWAFQAYRADWTAEVVHDAGGSAALGAELYFAYSGKLYTGRP